MKRKDKPCERNLLSVALSTTEDDILDYASFEKGDQGFSEKDCTTYRFRIQRIGYVLFCGVHMKDSRRNTEVVPKNGRSRYK